VWLVYLWSYGYKPERDDFESVKAGLNLKDTG
jgi:hypothetical protein